MTSFSRSTTGFRSRRSTGGIGERSGPRTTLLASHDVQRHQTSARELDDLRALVERDLADSKVAGLSADRRFATAYNAALQAANMAIACAGYRVTAKTGHHKVALDSVKLALGGTADKYADYFKAWIDASFPNLRR